MAISLRAVKRKSAKASANAVPLMSVLITCNALGVSARSLLQASHARIQTNAQRISLARTRNVRLARTFASVKSVHPMNNVANPWNVLRIPVYFGELAEAVILRQVALLV